jgi:hypothetical protein
MVEVEGERGASSSVVASFSTRPAGGARQRQRALDLQQPPTHPSTHSPLAMTTPADEEAPLPIPNLALPQLVFVLSAPGLADQHAAARAALLEGIEKDGQS